MKYPIHRIYVEWINLALNMNQCQNFVNKAMNVTDLKRLYITELFIVL